MPASHRIAACSTCTCRRAGVRWQQQTQLHQHCVHTQKRMQFLCGVIDVTNMCCLSRTQHRKNLRCHSVSTTHAPVYCCWIHITFAVAILPLLLTCSMLNSTTSSLAGLVASNLHCVVSSTIAFTASGAPCKFRPAIKYKQVVA